MQGARAIGAPANGRELGLVVGVGVLFVLAIVLGLPHVNGAIWAWPWRASPRLGVYGLSLIVLPFLLRIVEKIVADEPPEPRRILWPLAAICLAFQFAALAGEEIALDKLARIIRSPAATSYFTDAALIEELGAWLAAFPAPGLHAHSNTHPPGPILVHYALIHLAGLDLAPWVGGLAIGMAAAAGVFVVHPFAGLWGVGERERLLAAAVYATLPGLILFLPEFDQIYPIYAMALVLMWAAALAGSALASIGFGIVLWGALLFAYQLLVLGAFLGLLTAATVAVAPDRWRGFTVAARSALLALATVAVLYLLLHLLTGYRPVEAFIRALEWQAAHEQRPHPPALVVNLYDFALGGGMVVAALWLRHLAAAWNDPGPARTPGRLLSGLGAVGILVVNGSGLLDYETARVWLFLQPFVVVPAAIELARCHRHVVIAFFVVSWLVTTTLKAHLLFIGA